MKIKIRLLLLVLVMLAQLGHGQTAKYSNDFLAIGADARAMAMGQASISQGQQAFSLFYNPGLTADSATKYRANALHAEYFAGAAAYDALAFSLQRAHETFSVGIIRLGIDDIPNTLNLYDPNGNINYNNISTFSAADYALFLGYGKRIKSWSVGVSTKLIYRQIGPFAQAFGLGFDVGAVRNLGKYRFGMAIRNATSTFSLWTFNRAALQSGLEKAGNLFPQGSLEIALPSIHGGISRYFQFNSTWSMQAEFAFAILTDGRRNELLSTNVGSLVPSLGLEFGYEQRFFARAGIARLGRDPIANQVDFTPSLGAGIRLGAFQVDYAMTQIGDRTEGMFSNILSLAWRM